MGLIIEAGLAKIYNPYAHLDRPIKVASDKLADVFGDIDTALDKGKSLKKAVKGNAIGEILQKHIETARMEGFMHGAAVAKTKVPTLYSRTVRRAAEKRSGKVNAWMDDTTRKRLKLTPDSDYVLSPDRALHVARFETGRAYFKGMRDAYKGTSTKYRKKWITGEGDSCDDCLLNEDEGRIDIEAEFDSGHWGPPAHLNCPCWLAVTG
jgi:hypothetical protein